MEADNHDNQGLAMVGSTYLRGNQFNESREEENWDDESEQSEPDNFEDCEERGEFVFENRARYKGQWKGNVRHGYGI